MFCVDIDRPACLLHWVLFWACWLFGILTPGIIGKLLFKPKCRFWFSTQCSFLFFTPLPNAYGCLKIATCVEWHFFVILCCFYTNQCYWAVYLVPVEALYPTEEALIHPCFFLDLVWGKHFRDWNVQVKFYSKIEHCPVLCDGSILTRREESQLNDYPSILFIGRGEQSGNPRANSLCTSLRIAVQKLLSSTQSSSVLFLG